MSRRADFEELEEVASSLILIFLYAFFTFAL